MGLIRSEPFESLRGFRPSKPQKLLFELATGDVLTGGQYLPVQLVATKTPISVGGRRYFGIGDTLS